MARMARANGSPRKEERLDNALTLLFQTGVMFVIAFVGYTLVKTGKISLDRLDKPDAPEGSAPKRDSKPGRSSRERKPRRTHEA